MDWHKNEKQEIRNFSSDQDLQKTKIETLKNKITKNSLFITLSEFRSEELDSFKILIELEGFPSIPQSHLKALNTEQLVNLMVRTYRQESLKLTEGVLVNMNRTDLAMKLSDFSPATKRNHQPALTLEGVERLEKKEEKEKKMPSLDLHQSVLMHKVVTMRTVRELLLKTFSDLSYKERKNFRWLLQFTCFHKNLPLIPWRELQTAAGHHENEIKQMVMLLMGAYGQQCVEVIMSVFMNMNRTDLVQRLSDTSSAPEAACSSSDPCDVEMMEIDSGDKHWPELNQKVDEMMSVAESLFKVLTRLDLKRFREILFSQSDFSGCLSNIPLAVSEITELPDVLLLMVQSGCQQFVKTTEEVLKKMKTNLVLSVSSSEPKKEHLEADELLFAVTQKVATMAAARQLLLETLKALSHEEHKKFKVLLKSIVSSRNLPDISVVLGDISEEEKTVERMVHMFGQQCLEIMGEIFMNMKRPDLVQKLSVSSTALKGKHFVDEQQLEKTDSKQIIVETLSGLSFWDLEKFKWLLQFTCFQKSLPQIQRWELDWADTAELLVNMMTNTWGHQSLEVVNEVLMDMNRTDLVQTVSEKVKGQLSPQNMMLQKICKKEDLQEDLQEDSRKWTTLKPEVESRDAKESSIYSHQSEAGSFECSVSGLRWVCQEKVSFKYQFGSCEEPLKRMENIQYRPAGPLIDLTVSSGSFDEVYLPHWISIKNNPEILDQFAVLHIDDRGDAVEKVTEVTTSHVKLPNPTFSLNMVLVKWLGVPLNVKCKVLIYEQNTTSLKLRVYLIPRDAGLQEKLDRKEMTFGYNIMPPMPYPEDDLKINDKFCLTADLQDATILPESRVIQLRYDFDPNFFYVSPENSNARFNLSLTNVNSSQKVWTCPIQMDTDTSRAAAPAAACQPPPATTEQAQGTPEEDEHFVDKHEAELKRRVTNVPAILDDLLQSKVIGQEQYEKLLNLHPTQEQMRRLFIIVKATSAQKDIFYNILKTNEKWLVEELEKKT